MPWFAWLFVSLMLIIFTWWLLGEQTPQVSVDDDLTDLARAVGVYYDQPRLTAQEVADLRYRLTHGQRTSLRIVPHRDNT